MIGPRRAPGAPPQPVAIEGDWPTLALVLAAEAEGERVDKEFRQARVAPAPAYNAESTMRSLRQNTNTNTLGIRQEMGAAAEDFEWTFLEMRKASRRKDVPMQLGLCGRVAGKRGRLRPALHGAPVYTL